MISRHLNKGPAGATPPDPDADVKLSAEEASAPMSADQSGDAALAQSEESVFVFPATLAQRRFWLLDKLQQGGNPALNMTLPMRLHGPLNQSVLRRALNEVVARHEALRTTFSSERGELRQIISPVITLDLPLLDASDLPKASRAEFSAQSIREDAHLLFDLTTGPLVRARLVRLEEHEHLLLLTVHHIVSDGWSNGVLIRELCAFYSDFMQEQKPSLPELRLQFADYADWQHERLVANDFAWQREYWRRQLAGDLPVLDLPTDRARLNSRSTSGDIRARVLPPELVSAAKALATREGASSFMLFLAIFQVMLHRYTGQGDFLVTTPSANRERQEFESLIGLFVNPLLLRADLREDPTFSELLARVRRVVLEAFVNQDVPFELLLDEFQPSRLQVNFLHQSAFVEPAILPGGLSVEPLNCVSAGTVYDLSASILEDRASARLEMEYNTALFDAESIDRMLGHYQTLLEGVVADSAKPISALPLLTKKESQQFGPNNITFGNAAPVRLDVRAPLLERVMAKPDAVAARHGRRELSCAELLARMESAKNADRSARAASDLDQAAAWVGHWRARVDTPPPSAIAGSPASDASLSAGCHALRECAGLYDRERMAACSAPGAAAMEELGAGLLANALLVYPTPGLLADPAALATWLDAENIEVACLPAATWHRLAAAIAARKARKPAKLNLVIASEGEPGEGSFGRISPDTFVGSVRVVRRTVLEAVGTIALDGRPLPLAIARLRLLDSRSGQPLPAGVAGALHIADGPEDPTPTGELARWLSDGSVDRLGRSVEQQYARGFRLDLRETEKALCALPGVLHAVVRSSPGTGLIAYILPDPAAGTLSGDNALRQLLRERGLSDYLTPTAFMRLKDGPLRAADGHLDIDALPPPPERSAGASSEPVRPYLGLQLQLIAIWEEVLGVRGIGIRDDFFDLGGNSLLAMRMLQRTELACGKVILPTTLFAMPTIEHLAGAMARDVIDDSPNLLRVHDTGKQTPFFYLHGDLSGGGFYSLKLSRALGAEQPFYVLPPQDIRTLAAPPSIEEMAAGHLSALRAVRPNGPYVIGGFCIGGLVAYELAQQIVASGDSVEMLLLIDAAPEDKTLTTLRWLAGKIGALLRWDDQTKVAHFGRWAVLRARLAEWSGLHFRAQVRTVTGHVSRRFLQFGRVFRPGNRMSVNDANNLSHDAEARDVPSWFLWSSAGYRPQPYSGRVALLISEDVLRGARDISRNWQQLAPEVTVHPLTGSHLECITAHVDTLAETIDRCLQGVAASGLAQGEEKSSASVTVGFQDGN